MLAIPDESAHRSVVADWLEFKAITSPDSRIGFGTLVSANDLIENEQEQDIGEDDRVEDVYVLSVQTEIECRGQTIGQDYPFRIDPKGHTLLFDDDVSEAGWIYLFCLFLSHAFNSAILSESSAPNVTTKVRDLFQVCATVAAGGYVGGPAASFGHPRPEGEAFLSALRRIYLQFGDGTPCATPREAAPPQVKDDGVDVIAWRRSVDCLPTTHYLVGQVASGNNWMGKSVKADREHFHDYWFERKPGAQPEDAMFMPFALEPPNWQKQAAYGPLLTDYMQSLAYRFGTIFYRDRIAAYSAQGLVLIREGETGIERATDLTAVREWAQSYVRRLRST